MTVTDEGGHGRRRPVRVSTPNFSAMYLDGFPTVDPPAGIHFTPGNPFNVRAGVKVFF